ncbi:MAG: SDR family oxidoreductase [Chloroflexi bacterium]|nr:SDR family oxidoreductase [Chloroflexota bacterium]MCL5275721.1 SDR family oxidoreductase [Chloroflexota bacterium]
MTLQDKIILIVGGATGIGKASAELCAARGAKVIIADINESAGNQLAAAIHAPFLRVNVTDEQNVERLFQQVNERFGRLDVLIQTAGLLKGAYTSIEELTLETWKQVMDINVTGSFLCAKHATPLLKKSRRGVIILLSSGAAQHGSSSYAYGASKGGVTSLGITLAGKLAPDNIRVNVLHPGNIRTGMKLSVIEVDAQKRGESMDKLVAESHLGEPEGMAKVVAWLASDDADYIRGNVFTR